MKEFRLGRITVQILRGDIVRVEAEVIVCPSNSYLHMRGGAAQAIRVAGGDGVEADARRQAPIDIGRVAVTSGGNLAARYVYHAPTMNDPVEVSNEANVRAAVRASLHRTRLDRVESIAFPGMGTGTGEVPLELAAKAVIEEIVHFSRQDTSLRRIALVARSDRLESALLCAAEALGLISKD